MPIFDNKNKTANNRVYLRKKSLKLRGYVLGILGAFSIYTAYKMTNKHIS